MKGLGPVLPWPSKLLEVPLNISMFKDISHVKICNIMAYLTYTDACLCEILETRQ